MHDRRRLVDDVVTARAMAVATLPADDEEPEPRGIAWPLGIGRVVAQAGKASDLREKRDLVVLLGAHVIGWLEAIDEALGDDETEPES